MIELLPLLVLVAFGAAAWVVYRRGLDHRWVRVIAATAGCVLLLDALIEPSRRYPDLFFVFLSVVVFWRARDLPKRLRRPKEAGS